MVSPQEQVQDVRHTLMESPDSFQYSCFHLEHKEKRINDFLEFSELEGFSQTSELKLVEDPYTEKEARVHLLRTRDIVGATIDKVDGIYGVSAGLSLHDTVCPWNAPEASNGSNGASSSTPSVVGNPHALDDFQFDALNIRHLLPSSQESPPKPVKALGVSPWNPPPPFLRQHGHLLYIQLTTNEGEQFQITSHISGFFVSKSSNVKFDPFPRSPPKYAFAHSLFTLISDLSPTFKNAFNNLQEFNGRRDPLANLQITNAVPAYPWIVPSITTSLSRHHADLTRTQETYLIGGAENTETLRDWNEEIQNAKELPRENVQDKIFRERLVSKIYAEFNDTAARGAVLVARGEIPPLNPTENKDAQIFVYNNVFYSFGVDGVATFASEGGDEAARVAVSKDVAGVKAVNQLDIDKVATPGTIIVDYLGKRLVAQSIVPGIFKQRDPDEHQVDYGGVEGREVVADNEAFVPIFSKVSKALRVKKHSVWDKEGKEHVLEASVETKGLLGTDGRMYMLDLYRLTPLDALWLEENRDDSTDISHEAQSKNYPHRMTVLRQELVDAYWRLKLGEYVKEQVQKNNNDAQDKAASSSAESESGSSKPLAESQALPSDPDTEEIQKGRKQEHVDISAFTYSLNPDVFCGQVPQSEEQKAEWAKDEENVRTVCLYLRDKIMPELLHDIKEGETGFPFDGNALSGLLHKRGINIRYLGRIATLANQDNMRMRAFRALAIQEMIARGFKHVTNKWLRNVPVVFARNCLAHLLNNLLGFHLNTSPKAEIDETLAKLYPDADLSFCHITPSSLQDEIAREVQKRYRFDLDPTWMDELRHMQLLRNVCLKLGMQLVEREFAFFDLLSDKTEEGQNAHDNNVSHPHTNGLTNGQTTVKSGKKKKKAGGRSSPTTTNGDGSAKRTTTFAPDDIVNTIPVIKEASPRSRMAEEALEGGKISMMQNQKEVGQELLIESLTLHEQIYGVLHSEVARVYHQLAMLYYQIDEKAAAVELAHKAVIISERTLGVDSNETILAYLNLALFEHGNRNTAVALAYVRHALELGKIAYGSQHPDCTTTLNNAAVMLQNLQAYQQSRRWFETSLKISEEVSGKASVSTATLLFQLAQALVLDGDHKGAVQRMREAYSVFLSKLGADDPNTKESEKWLEQLTQNAVSIAKHQKDIQNRRVRRLAFNPRTPNLAGQTQLSQSPSDIVPGQALRANGGLDKLNMDELVKWIEGGGNSSKTNRKKHTGPSNPRRRTGPSNGASTA